MAKLSLDQLRKGDVPRGLPERSYPLCLRRDLLAEVDALTNQLRDAEITGDDVDPESLPPKRLGEGEAPAVTGLRAKLSSLYDEMDEATGDLRLRAIQDGEWRQWVNAHPPRDGDQRDADIAYGMVNADDLAADLAQWVLSWNGDLLDEGDWDRSIAPLASGGDLKALVSIVLQIQEAVEDPKLRRLVSLGGPTSSDAASWPEPLDDPPPSSTDESPPSDTSTTTLTET